MIDEEFEAAVKRTLLRFLLAALYEHWLREMASEYGGHFIDCLPPTTAARLWREYVNV